MPDSKPVESASGAAEHVSETDEGTVTDVSAAVLAPVAAVVEESAAASTDELIRRMDDRHKELMDCLARVEERVDAAMAALENAAPKPADEAASVAAAEVAETPVVVAVPEPVAEVKPEKTRRGFSNVLRRK